MAIEMINVGAAANDGTGDDLREAFVKINQNFEDLDLRIDDKTEAVNVGSGVGVYKQRTGYNLEFKSLVAGNNVTLQEFENQITLAATGGLQNLIFLTDSGSVHVADGQTVRIQGGTGTTTRWDGNAIKVDNTKLSSLNEDPNPTLAGNLDGNLQSIGNVDEITANIFRGAVIGPITGDVNGNVIGNVTGSVTGDLTGNVHGVDIREFFSEQVDFGSINVTANNWFDLLKATLDIDMGTINSPASFSIDGGLMPAPSNPLVIRDYTGSSFALYQYREGQWVTRTVENIQDEPGTGVLGDLVNTGYAYPIPSHGTRQDIAITTNAPYLVFYYKFNDNLWILLNSGPGFTGEFSSGTTFPANPVEFEYFHNISETNMIVDGNSVNIYQDISEVPPEENEWFIVNNLNYMVYSSR